jgi:hypothetical protein
MTPYEQGYYTFMKMAGFADELGRTLVSPISLAGNLGDQIVFRGARAHLDADPTLANMTPNQYASMRGIPTAGPSQLDNMTMRQGTQMVLDQSTQDMKDNAARAAMLGIGAAGIYGAKKYYDDQQPWYKKL